MKSPNRIMHRLWRHEKVGFALIRDYAAADDDGDRGLEKNLPLGFS